MKKITSKIVFICCFCMLILSAPFFGGCQVIIQLNEPSFVNFQINEDTGEQMLVTENNVFASGYIFGVSTVYENGNTSNFLRYRTGRNKPYLDVTDIFLNAQTYYFYAQAIGVNDYLSSDISEVFSYTIQYKLGTTTLALSGTHLSWTAVENANVYVIYANNNVIAEVSANSYDVANFIEGYNKNDPINFHVVCKQNGNYLRSASSNVVTYTDHLKLTEPTNLKITKSGEQKILSWNAVSNCSKYLVEINDQFQVEVENANSLDVSSYYTQLGVYKFKVKAIGHNYFISSQYSSDLLDTYTQKLATPQNVRCIVNTSTIDICWDTVEFAKEYQLYVNGKLFLLNEQTGVDSPIVSNNIIVTFEQLGLTSAQELENLLIQVVAKGYGYYTYSDMSTGKTVVGAQSILPTPVVELEQDVIKISNIENAVSVDVEISSSNGILVYVLNTSSAESGVLTFDYANYLTHAGTYTIRAKANAHDEAYNSKYSSSVSVIIEQQPVLLASPVISNVSVDGNNVVVNFSADENTLLCTLLANDQIVTSNLTYQSNKVSLSSVLNLVGSTNAITFKVYANAYEYFVQSENSNSFVMSTVLDEISNINLNGTLLSWDEVKNAQKYVIAIDNQIVDLNSNQTSVNLSNYVSANKTRQILISAETQGFTGSGWSEKIYFNNVAIKRAGYTDKYFYYGETYDYYITSQKELNDLLMYCLDNFIEEAEFYIDFETSTTNKDKISTATDNITGTFGYSSFVITGGSKTSGACSFNISLYDVMQTNTTSPYYQQWQNTEFYSSNVGRSQDYDNFVTDKYLVSQNVYATNSLISCVQNKAKPNFVYANSVAEQVYNKAKQILIEICDDSMTDYQKALAIHDYIIKNVSYDYQGLDYIEQFEKVLGSFHYVEEAILNGFAVCDGYAKMFSLLCNMEGIQTICISGDVDGAGHAWNKIYLDADGNGQKEWYVVDCTHDDGAIVLSGSTYELASHDNFMVADSVYADRNENIDYPSAETVTGTYYQNYKLGELSIIIDTYAKYLQIVEYMNTNNLSGVEVLINRNILTACRNYAGANTIAIGYDQNANYALVFVY